MKPNALALSQRSQLYLGSNSVRPGNHINSLCQDILFLPANLAVILYIIMKNSCLQHFSSSYLQESRGITSAKRSFQFKAIQFNLPHLNSTLRDQPDKNVVLDTLRYTQINKMHIFGLKETNKSTGCKGKQFTEISSLIKLKMYTHKYIEISKSIRLVNK